MTRQCDAIACPADVATGKFMCIQHWRLVPIELQRTISDRFRSTRKDFGFLSDEMYLGACDRAIKHLAKREGKPESDNSYARLLRALLKRKGEAA